MKKNIDRPGISPAGHITDNGAARVQRELRTLADPEKARHLRRFFKTGEGEYGEGDNFLGINVPAQRTIAKKYRNVPLSEVSVLVRAAYHEERLIGLLILTYRYPRASEKEKEEIFNFYMAHTSWINNWDLVDVTAPKIVGPWLENRHKGILYEMAGSENLWHRRIAILSTLHFIRCHDFEDTVKLAHLLINDTHDLIHKAVGWMLREAGKRNPALLVSFLDKHHHQMPRTMLRYAIERLPEEQRKSYLTQKKST